MIRCADKYEALKLASMVLARRPYITSILDIIDDEVVVSLHDKSAHSIMMHDGAEAERFAAYMQSVLEGMHIIHAADVAGDVVSLGKSTQGSCRSPR